METGAGGDPSLWHQDWELANYPDDTELGCWQPLLRGPSLGVGDLPPLHQAWALVTLFYGTKLENLELAPLHRALAE